MVNKHNPDIMFKMIDARSVPPAPAMPPRMDQDFVRGSIATPAGDVPRIDSILYFRDHWRSFKARWDIGRMDYTVDPGLYALGHPDSKSPVLVSSNYKMSFDSLRSALPGRDAWILVLDTNGINVWCAAGEGTFGTDEVVRRIETTGLKEIVGHREIVVPQLGGPGVSGYQVKLRSGFRARFGPIKAEDIPAYLDAGFKATRAMRKKSFDLGERIALIPVELVHTFRPALFIIPVLFLLGGLGGPGGFWANASNFGVFAVLAFLSALVGGVALTPVLLPYLPGRAFTTKGIIVGAAIAAGVLFLRGDNLRALPGLIETLSWLMIITALSAYLAMNFTGCSTYTSLSGVKKEMRWALPLQIAMVTCGLAGWLTSRFIS